LKKNNYQDTHDAIIDAAIATGDNTTIMNTVLDVYEATKSMDNVFTFGFNNDKDLTALNDNTYRINMDEFSDMNLWTINYAGYYLLPLVRATGTTKVTSVYAVADVYALPKVKLDTPELIGSYVTETIEGGAYNTANYSTVGSDITTQMSFNTYTWSRDDECADYFEIELIANDSHVLPEGSIERTKTKLKIRIVKNEDSLTLTKVLNDDESTATTENIDVSSGYAYVTIDGLTNLIEGTYNYTGSSYIHYLFEANVGLEYSLIGDSFTYTLIVPNPNNQFVFDYTVSDVTYGCSGTYSDKYQFEGKVMTGSNREEFISSDQSTIGE